MVLYFFGASAAIGMCGDWHRSAVINCPFWLSGYCHKSGASRPIVGSGVSAYSTRKMRRRDGVGDFCVGGLLVGVFASEGYSSAFLRFLLPSFSFDGIKLSKYDNSTIKCYCIPACLSMPCAVYKTTIN